MNKLFLVSFLAFFFLGCSQLQTQLQASQEVKYTTYNSQYFSIDYPDSWNVEEEKTTLAVSSISFISRIETSRDPVLDAARIEVFSEASDFSTFEHFEASEKLILYEGEKIISTQKITFKGHEALKIDIDAIASPENPATKVKGTTIYLKVGKVIYRFYYGFEVGKDDKFQSIFDKMLDSFEAKTPLEVTEPEPQESIEQKSIQYLKYNDSYFSLNYPEDWVVTPQTTSLITRFSSKLETSLDTLRDELLVEIFEESEAFSTFSDFEVLQTNLMYEGEKLNSKETVTFKGNPALKIIIDGVHPEDPTSPIKTTYTTIFFKKDGLVYRLHYAFEVGKEEKFQPIFDKMLDSFEVKIPPKTPAITQQITYKKYDHDYFSIEYPQAWNIDERIGYSVDFYSKKENANDLIFDDLLVEILAEDTGFSTFDDFEEYEKSLMYEGEKITLSKRITFEGKTALKIDIDGLSSYGDKLKVSTIYVKNGDIVYRISYVYEASKASKYQPIFDKMLDSFKIK